MADDDEAPDLLRLAILTVLADAGRPLTAEEVAEALARLALEGQRVALGLPRSRGH